MDKYRNWDNSFDQNCVFFSTQWNPGLIVWMIYNFWLCVWTKNYLANSFDQVGTVIRTREKWKIQFGADDKSNLKFMFQSEGDHNMSSFEADLKKQILGRWEYLRKRSEIKSFFYQLLNLKIKEINSRSKAEKVFRPWWDTLEDYLLNSLVLLGE